MDQLWVKLNIWHALRDEADYFEGALTRCSKNAEGLEPVDKVPAGEKICSICDKMVKHDNAQVPE